MQTTLKSNGVMKRAYTREDFSGLSHLVGAALAFGPLPAAAMWWIVLGQTPFYFILES